MADVHTVVLVEGSSDRAALLALAGRRGRDLDAEGVLVVAMGGITNTYACLRHYLPTGVRLAGSTTRRRSRTCAPRCPARTCASTGFSGATPTWSSS